VGTGNPSTMQMRAMLRTLLRDRFKLVTRTESRNRPIFALTVSRGNGRLGPKLRPTSPECAAAGAALANAAPSPDGPPDPSNPRCGTIAFSPGFLSGRGVRTNQLANSLGGMPVIGRAVTNRTALEGAYDFELRWSPPAPPGIRDAPVESDAPEIFTALREQLGLKLESTRGPVDVLVIVTVEQPTPD